MKKTLFNMLAVCAAVSTLSSAAFGATLGNGITGTGATAATTALAVSAVSLENLPAAGLAIADSLKVSYTSTNNFNPNDVLTFNFTNVSLNESSFKLCDATTVGTGVANTVADYLGSIDTTGFSVTQLVFRFSTTVTGNDVLYVAGTCETTINALAYATASSALDIRLPQLALAGSATVATPAATFNGGTITAAIASARNLYTVTQQFTMPTTGFTAASGTIDFAGGLKTVGSATKVATGGTALTLLDSGVALPLGVQGANFSTNDAVVFSLSGTASALNGVAKVCYELGTLGTCGTVNAFVLNSGANLGTYSASLNGLTAAGGTNKNITFVFDGATSLTARTWTLGGSLATGTNVKNGHALFSGLTIGSLTLNSTQYYIPLIKTTGPTANFVYTPAAAAAADTYIKLSSKNSANGTNGVTVSVLCNNYSGQNSPMSAAMSYGSITPGTALVISGTQLAASALALTPSCVVDGVGGYSAIVTVNAPNTDVFGYASIVENGLYKRVPVQTVNTTAIGATVISE